MSSTTPDVTIYTTHFCGYCRAAKALLNKKGITFTEIDLTGDHAGRNALIQRADGRMTVPQIFIGRHHVGGYDDLYALDQAGRLDPLLAASAERAAEG